MWVAFVDDPDGCDRESWSVFYTPFFVGNTEHEAVVKAKAYIAMEKSFYDEEDECSLSIHVREERKE